MNKSGVINKSEKLIERWQFTSSALELKSSIIRTILKESSKPGVVNFAGGLPAPETFPIDDIKEVCIRVLDKYGPDPLQYSISQGILPLREFIADWISTPNYKCTPEEIQITGGSQQALDIFGRVFIPRDAVILTEEPTYLGALQAFSYYHCGFASVKTDEQGMVPDDLEAKIKKHNPSFIYVVPDFQNPAGYTWSEDRRAALIDLARKYDVPVVDDNPYRELRYSGEAPPSLKEMGGQHVIQMGTFSKLISPGLRIGWMVADPEVITLCERMKQAADLHTNTFAQYVIYEFAKDGGLDNHIEKVKTTYSKRRDAMIEALRDNFDDGTTWTEPVGGLFLWIKLPGGKSASVMFDDALKAGIAYVPGKHFFSENPDDSTLRLNFCNASEDNIREGVKRLAKVIKAAN